MWCPRCANEVTNVTGTFKGVVNERCRKCPSCGYTFMTIEAIKSDKYWALYAKHSLESEADEKTLKKLGIEPNQESFDF